MLTRGTRAGVESTAALIESILRRLASLERGGRSGWEAGDFKATFRTTEAPGWLNHNQTVVDAETLYPKLWANAPVAWRSGSDLNLPDLTDVAVIGAGNLAALGGFAGSNTSTALKNHSHSFTGGSHDHDIQLSDVGTGFGAKGVSNTGANLRSTLTASVSGTVGTTGTGSSFSILQRSIGVNFQFRT